MNKTERMNYIYSIKRELKNLIVFQEFMLAVLIVYVYGKNQIIKIKKK